MTRKKISIITPFFQRKSGLLRNAVTSALRQCVDANLEIIIVDDGSPVPAEAELEDLQQDHTRRITLIKQKNAGCYPASNTALDHVQPDTDFVAFLDSDDVWTEHHLRNALLALSRGYDFYFSDFYQLNQKVTAFNRAKRIDVSQHRRIHESEPIHAYEGDMVAQIITGSILGTSTIVYDFRKFSELRYRTEYQHTGGEYILWLQLALGTRKIAFSAIPECTYGSGVNIYSESSWGTDKYLSVAADEIRYRKWIRGTSGVSPQLRAFLQKKIWERRAAFCRGLFHNALHKSVNFRLLRRQARLDPMTFCLLPIVPGLILSERVKQNHR